MGFVEFAMVSVKAVFQISIVAFSGFVFARRGILNPAVMKNVSKISIDLLTPCLLFSKIVETLELESLAKLWIVPASYLLYGIIGLAWTQGTSRALRLPKAYTRFLDVSVFFINSNTLPFALIYSIATSPDAAFLRKNGDDTLEMVAARGISYAMLFGIPNNLLRWSIGMKWLDVENATGINKGHGGSSHHNSTDTLAQREPDTGPKFHRNQPFSETSPLLISHTTHQTTPQDTPLMSQAPIKSTAKKLVCNASKGVKGLWSGYIAPFMNPPIYGILFAIIVLLFPGLQKNMVQPGTFLHAVYGGISMLGDACIPMVIISLGAQLGIMGLPVQQDTELSDSSSCAEDECRGSRSSSNEHLQRVGVLVVMMGRCLIVPAISSLALITLKAKFPHIAPMLSEDPILLVVLLLLSACPPAINIVGVSQATGKFQDEAAVILFWSYILGTAFLAAWISGFLWLGDYLNS
ncbi:hypothetical protein H4219_001496 [Mycoemilia scoparia]|uniref:Auxin efflux carrier n=1 Tax=Mycoemilia scoparia TaxID=417184 RepID=A0A9W8A399_9FUNG|nr:hypothetical protein H4219_001496 [Mycoemilia scoparia]